MSRRSGCRVGDDCEDGTFAAGNARCGALAGEV